VNSERDDEFVPDKFEDGDWCKYVHVDCAYEAGVHPHELRPGWCTVGDHQFYKTESVIKAELGIITEHSKVPIPVFLVEASGGCVHWACAWDAWGQDLFRGLNERAEENGR
jgi:hypothetical protein